MNFEITFKISEADYVTINRQIRTHFRKKNRWLRLLRYIVLLILAYLLYLPDKADNKTPIWSFLILFFLGIFWLLPFFISRFHRKTYRSTPALNSDISLSFSEEKITRISKTAKSEILWPYYNTIVENKDFLLLINGPNTFTAVPKNKLSEEQKHWVIKRIKL